MLAGGEKRSSLEDTLKKFMDDSAKRHVEHEELMKQLNALTKVAIKNQASSIKNLKVRLIR